MPLTVTEFWVVHALAQHPGHVRSREQLMAAANVVLDDGTVTSQIKRIRAKFCERRPDVRRHPNRLRHGLSLAGGLTRRAVARRCD